MFQIKLEQTLDAAGEEKIIEGVKAFLISAQDEELHGHLSSRETEVIERYFGLGREKQKTRAIASELGITGSRVHQILARGSRKVHRLAIKQYPLRMTLHSLALTSAPSEILNPEYTASVKQRAQQGEALSEEILKLLSVEQFNLSQRTVNSLIGQKLFTLFDLTKMTKVELLRSHNFGNSALREVEKLLAEFGLKLPE